MNNLNILYVLHTGIVNEQGFVGGTQLQVEKLAKSNISGKSYLLFYEEGYLVLEEISNGPDALKLFFPVLHTNSSINIQKDYREIYHMILIVFGIDLVHINHLQNHTIDLINEADKLNIPIVFTAHDFHTVCPAVYLMDMHNNFCEGRIDGSVCSSCLMYRTGFELETLNNWRLEFQKIYKKIDQVIAPSSFVLEVIRKHYDVSNGIAIPHGTDIFEVNKPQEYQGGNFNVAFVGHLVEHKGSKVILDIIKNCKDSSVIFHSFGKIHDGELLALNSSNFIKHGSYDPGTLQKLLIDNSIHAVALMSICPESFSFTLSEAWQCGIPVIGCDIGAIGKRIEQSGAGLLVNKNEAAGETLLYIEKLKNEPDLYENQAKKSLESPQKNIQDMIKEYTDIYKLLTDRREHGLSELQNIQGFFELMFCDRKTEDALHQYNNVANELESIKESLLYKVFIKINNINFPGRQKMKRFAVKFLKR